MQVRAFKYLLPLVIYPLAYFSFTSTGWLCWLPMIYAWVMIPLAELVLRPDTRNLSEAEEEMVKKSRIYDLFLYMIVFMQFPTLFFFLYRMQSDQPAWPDIAGRVLSMGLICGSFGINVGHELGHRVNRFEQWLAKISLLSSLYMHFFVEHNKGHHKNVATQEDPSSARFGEMVYTFYFRTIVYSWISAWHIALADLKKKGRSFFSIHNEMLLFQLMQAALVITVGLVFSWLTCLYFLAAAGIGILLLETVNYIEHYGLRRRATGEGKYERAMPWHSWNSNHIIGRLMLFELSRHSDHHYMASRKYQVLRHHTDAPQMPTGYPGMMLLSLVPPAWFWVMNKRVRKMNAV